MKTISLCMIVRDEELVLENCLKSISDLMDEIIIVDTGSIDKTKEIAQKYTDKIYDFKWVDDFSKARNYSFSKGTKDYLMWCDADDVFTKEDHDKLKKLKEEMDGKFDIYTMNYICKRDQNGNPTLVNKSYRIFKRENNYIWEGRIHEFIKPIGKIKNTDINVIHNKLKVNDPKRNDRIFEKMIKDGHKFTTREEYCYAMHYYYQKDYDKAIKLYNDFINKYLNNYQNNKHYLYKAIIDLADCYQKTNELDKEIDTLFLILKNDIPKADCLVKIGNNLLTNRNYKTAIYYYELAIQSTENITNKDQYNFTAYFKLAYCYFKIKEYKKAYICNEEALKIRSDNKTALDNKKLYEKYVQP